MSIHDKLTAIQSDLKVPKNQTNTYAKYKYRSCEDILEAIKPLLKENNCSLILSDEVVFISGAAPQSFTTTEWSEKAQKNVDRTSIIGGDRFYIKATATLYNGNDSISASAFAREEDSKRGMDSAQITGAASSYARKYALNGLFCIDDTEDADATNNTKIESYKQKEVSASEDDIKQITALCADTKTNQVQLYRYFQVNGTPTKEQAQKMIASLNMKLSKQLDAISVAQS